MTVVGAKTTGVGVGSIVLGGGRFTCSCGEKKSAIKCFIFRPGYSYLSNQYGLSVDNVVSFELVMPNGTVANITGSSNPDLFYGLRVSVFTWG